MFSRNWARATSKGESCWSPSNASAPPEGRRSRPSGTARGLRQGAQTGRAPNPLSTVRYGRARNRLLTTPMDAGVSGGRDITDIPRVGRGQDAEVRARPDRPEGAPLPCRKALPLRQHLPRVRPTVAGVAALATAFG